MSDPIKHAALRSAGVPHSSQEALLVLLEGRQAGADLQQRGSAPLRAARQQTAVLLNPEAVQGLVTHLRTTADEQNISGNISHVTHLKL